MEITVNIPDDKFGSVMAKEDITEDVIKAIIKSEIEYLKISIKENKSK